MSAVFVAAGRVIVREFCDVYGHVPYLLRKLPDLLPMARRCAIWYLRWRMRKIHSLDIERMITNKQVCIDDLDYFLAECEHFGQGSSA